jgi:hypothetical protein
VTSNPNNLILNMTKPNNRARRRKKQVAESVPPLERQEICHQSTPAWFGRKMKTIGEVVAIVLTIILGPIGIHDTFFQKPQIHAQTAQISAPFSLYFSLHNPSWVLDMNNVRIQCGINDVMYDANGRIAGFTLRAHPINLNQNISVPPGETIQYICPFDKAFELGPERIRTAQIQLQTQFSTLGIERNTHSEVFNWDHISRQWTEGVIVN